TQDERGRLVERIVRLGHERSSHNSLSPNAFATRFSTPSAITSDGGTVPKGGKVNFAPRHEIVPDVKSISISSPGMIVFSLAEISLANRSRRRFTSSGTSTQRKPLLYALR